MISLDSRISSTRWKVVKSSAQVESRPTAKKKRLQFRKLILKKNNTSCVFSIKNLWMSFAC